MDGEGKLKALREEMSKRGYDAYIIPHEDQHDNEYISEGDERIKFISNFSGSNGIGLVTKDIALMWTDGRYFIQIEKELYPGWKMMKMEKEAETIHQYIEKHLPKKIKIGMDYNLFSQESADIFFKMEDYTFIDDTNNIIDLLWGEKKPKYKTDKVMILSTEYSGASVEDKFNKVCEKLKELIPKEKESVKKIRYLVSRLDDIAWILNLRGTDIPYNPVFFSFGLLYSTENGNYFHLFSNKVKFDSPEMTKYLDDNKIILHNYSDIYQVLSTPSSDTLTIMDKVSTNSRLFTIAKEKQGEEMCIVVDEDQIENIKSIKNEVELKGYRAANVRDSVALVKFFTWMEQELINKKRTDLNEYEIGLMNKKFREEQKLFMGESFAPICAAGPNAAIIHYEQNENLHSNMSVDQLILCDTGGQYLDGTTDITRTVHYGKPKDKEKEYYTRVLLGNLSLERCIFKKASLNNLDAVARSFLLQVAESYNHGTSHGVGHFLNVHEGPYGNPLLEGNVITNEPGYYEKDAFGIRIENMMVVVKKTPEKLGFENITLVPYERNLIDLNLISPDMVKYIDDYHKKVWNTLSPLLENDKDALNYLKRKTRSLLEKDE